MLYDALQAKVPDAVATLKALRKEHGHRIAAVMTVDQVMGGLKGLEPEDADALRIPQKLSGAKVTISGIPGSPLMVHPDGLRWLGRKLADVAEERPSTEQLIAESLLGEAVPKDSPLCESVRAELEEYRFELLDHPDLDEALQAATLASEVHPSNAVAAVVAMLAPTFLRTPDLHRSLDVVVDPLAMFQDTMKLHAVSGIIYPAVHRSLYQRRKRVPRPEVGLTAAQAFVQQLGYAKTDAQRETQASVFDLLMLLMAYHGPGNVSTYVAKVAASGGADVARAWAAMLAGLSGYNHGGAAEKGLDMLAHLEQTVGHGATAEQLRQIAQHRWDSGLALWNGGHRLLRVGPDGRVVISAAELERRFPNHPLYTLAKNWFREMVAVLKESGKVKFAEMNVDAYTGLLAHLSGIIPLKSQSSFATSIFGMSRWIGAGAECWWQRMLYPSIIRPGSLSEEMVPDLPTWEDLITRN